MHNFQSLDSTSNKDDFFQQLKIIFLHQFIHILGFRKDILERKNLIFSTTTQNRWNTQTSSQRSFINSTKVTELAKKYYGTNSFNGFELEAYDEDDDTEGEDNIHYHPRILLGEIMSHKSYYVEQYISEFTLGLLEDLGWYEINYYTGGLMRFGRNQGNYFFSRDCVEPTEPVYIGEDEYKEIDYYKIISSFPNEFCSSLYEGSNNKFGLCSPGRLSMSYCLGKTTSLEMETDYRRNYSSVYFGRNAFIEYCPISEDIISSDTKLEYYKGNCNIGNGRYGRYMTFKDTSGMRFSFFNGSFSDSYSNESFCALSSLLQKNKKFVDDESFDKINGLIRPTCYNMNCSEKSLTIQVGKEYFVCPREGGILRINNTWTEYQGILYCPDYNLICTGTEVCNDIFSCIEKKSISKLISGDYTYDYDIKDISMMLKTYLDNRISASSLKIGFEKSEDGKCPLNCSQCINNNQCTLCHDTASLYIGTKENDTNPIKCAREDPGEGYYRHENYIQGKIFYFRCIDNCLVCNEETKTQCLQCEPTHYLNENKQCVERIPGCKNYDKINTMIMPDNGNRDSYIYCDDCNNDDGYYCFNMNRSTCIRMEDYNMTLNLSLYYKMENKNYSCIQRCDENFMGGCETCNKQKCTKCYDTSRVINNNGHCIESIDHCTIQDLTEDYKRCTRCDYQNNYYCFKTNRSECIYIPQQNISAYYKIENNDNSCYDLCAYTYTSHCLECTNAGCTKCEEGFYLYDGQCIQNITGCVINYFSSENNQTECDLCDSSSNYYCTNKNKSICNKMDTTTFSLYYKFTDISYPCYGLCSDKYPNCINCTSTNCYECTERYLINYNKTKCLRSPSYLDEKAACSIKIFELNETLDKNFNLSDLANDYYQSVKSTNEVHYYIGNNFSIVLYINSDCTEGLFNEGYFDLDTKELNKTLVIEAKSKLELIRHTIGIYINYNYRSHLRFHDLDSSYLIPEEYCPDCRNITYTMNNNLYRILKELYGEQIIDLILNEKLDIFNSELNIYKDPCYNLTLNGIDIPIHLRKNILYIETNRINGLLCRDVDCELIEYNFDTKKSICKCKMDNEYEDIFIENDFDIIKYKESLKAKGFSESVKVIKCLNNGFKGKYMVTNFGIMLSLIAFILQLIFYIYYCCCGKPLANTKKPSLIANPPKDSNTRIYLYSDWNLDLKYLNTDDDNNNNNNKAPKISEAVIQPRDDAEDQILEEERSFNKDDFNFSDISIDTNAGGIFPDKLRNSQRTFNKDKKVLILVGNKGKKKISLEQSINKDNISEESDDKLLVESKKHKKVSFCRNYWIFVSIKQHIINYFSYLRCCKMTESYIPLTIRFMRSLFIIILSFIVNIVWLDQKYFEKKLFHFDKKYSLINSSQKEINIPLGEKLSYAFSHTFVYALIGFLILTLADFIIGYVFFSFRDEVQTILLRKKTSQMQDMVLKARRNYNIFFVIDIILIIIFILSFAGFEATYQGGTTDYFMAGFISLILNELLPFLWSLILALCRYFGIKKKYKCLLKFSEFFLY